MSDYGLKIMKKGKDITSNNVLDYIFWSKHPSLNIKHRGSLTLTSPGGQQGEEGDDIPVTVGTYTHSFGYKPQFMAFTKSYVSGVVTEFEKADYVNLDFVMDYPIAGIRVYERIKAWVTDTELKVSVSLYFWEGIPPNDWWSTSAHEYTIDYILFMEEAKAL